MSSPQEHNHRLREIMKSIDPRSVMESHYQHLPEYQSPVLNIQNGFRVTKASSEPHVDSRVYLCGGSTVFCAEVADHETLPSHLQLFFNSHKVRAQVENWGRMGATLENRVWYLLQRERPKPGELVIFLFGANDSGYRELNHNRGVNRSCFRVTLFQILGYYKKRPSRRTPKVIRAIRMGILVYVLSPLVAEFTVRRTLRILRSYCQLTEQRGGRAIAVLQPSLLDWHRRFGGRDIRLARNMPLEAMDRRAYRRYRQIIRAQKGEGWLVDGSKYLDRATHCYLDWIHVNSTGNSLLAERIGLMLIERRLLPVRRT